VVTRTESATENNEIALGTLLDIEGASDRTSFDVLLVTKLPTNWQNWDPNVHLKDEK
jgi:hypothetical protein